MTNKIYWLITSLSILTLTACVGAVTIGGTSPESALINKCIVGNTAQSDPTCAKVVADTNGCITNPFLSGCEANPLFSPHVQNARDERVKFCNDNQRDNRCTGLEAYKNICNHDPFSILCSASYDSARKEICEDALTFPRCANTVSSICRTDPFNTDLCFSDDTYNSEREKICKYTSNFSRCATTVRRVCDADPFSDTLCFKDDTYHNIQETTCADEPDSSRCARTVSRVCGTNPFDTFCVDNPDYFRAQKYRCASEKNSDRCAPVIARVCEIDSLDTICSGLVTYFPAQEAVCASEPYSDRCTATVDRVCLVNAFDSLCQKRDLTSRELPAKPNEYFHYSATGNTPTSRCDRQCHVFVPNIINIKPLNDSNTGTAIYAGFFSLEYNFSATTPSTGNRRKYYAISLSKNIDIIVNFDDNMLSYSGSLERFESSYNLSIDGNFTDRGILTGTVNFRDAPAPLVGLIGQTKAIGAFVSGYNDTERSDFAGGFTATRE